MLRILSLVLLLPLILFMYVNFKNSREKKELLSKYDKDYSNIAIIQTEIQALTIEKDRLETEYEKLGSALFSEEDITFYEFCDFIVNSAKNRGVRIDNYSTNESAEPKRLNLSGSGNITSVLDFLNYLYLFDKKIDIGQIAVSHNSDNNDYKLTMLINFISMDTLKRTTQ